jgi:hypothetical protein
VGPNGYIEKVRTNRALYSEDQSNAQYSSVINAIASRVAVANPLTGQNNAYKITSTSASDPYTGNIVGGLTDGENTFSLWLWTDAGQSTEATLFFYNGLATEVYFKAFTITTTPTRYSFTVNFASVGASAVVRLDLRQTGAASYLYTYGWQAESGAMTDYIPTTSAAVSVGPVSGTPRLDYLGSDCGRLLLEPQRSNLFTYSEQLNNAAWSKNNTTITANAAISPDGYMNADKMQDSTSGAIVTYMNQNPATSGTQYTSSGFFKKAEYNFVLLHAFGLGGAVFNLNTGVLVSQSGGTGTITSYGDGWYRCTYTFTATGGGVFFTQTPTGSISYTGTAGSGIYAYGLQLEQAAYATSYIGPTLGTAVTRVGDVLYKTGIGSLFGASAGTIYFETTYYPETNTGSGERWIYAQGNTSSDLVRLWQDVVGGAKRIRALVSAGGVQVANLSVTATSLGLSDTASGTIKFALAYENDRFQMYVNGINAAVDTSGTAPTLTEINFNNTFATLMPLAQCLVFPTALSNAQLAELTSL